MEKPGKPYDHPRIFWDVDVNKIDFEAKANFVIERVFERGDVQDIRNCRRYYGDEKIEYALTKAKWLSLHSIYLAAALFNNQLTDYRCFRDRQLNPQHFQF